MVEGPSREEQLVAWVQKNQRPLGIGAAVVIAAGLLVWFLAASAARKEAFATQQLEQAWAAMDAGNLPQASSELQRVASTYGGTNAAHEATLSLNQARLEMGQGQLAVEDLRRFAESNPPVQYRFAAWKLLGTALEDLDRPAEAAEAYRSAASDAEMDFMKADALLSAARASVNAGDTAGAMAALNRVMTEFPETAAAPAAELRLAELSRPGT